MLTLTNIQDNVPKDIWLRGKHFLSFREFVNVKRLTLTEWAGFVCTTEKHKVLVHLDGEKIIDWQCDCCHNNEICEHVVAVLYAIYNELHSIEPYPSPYLKEEKKMSDEEKYYAKYPEERPFIKKNIQSMLQCWPAEEVISFLGQYASTHPECEAALLKEFLDPLLNEDGDETSFREQARECFESPAKKGQSLSQYTSDQWQQVDDNLVSILASAREMVLNNRFMDAADIALEIVNYVGAHLREIPEREWLGKNNFFEIFGEIEDVLINILVDPLSPDEVNEKIFREMSNPDMMKLFVNDAVYILILQTAFIACELTQTPEEVLDFIDRTIDIIDIEVMHPSMLIKQIYLLRCLGSEDEAERILEEYLDIEEVRGAEIKYQLSCGNYKKALQLVKDAMSQPQDSFFPWAWDKIYKEICEETNDKESLIDYYKTLFLSRGGEIDHFIQLKELVPPEQLKPLAIELLSQKKTEFLKGSDKPLKAQVFFSAGMYDELWDFLISRSKDRLFLLVSYAFCFRKKRMDELKAVLEEEICRYAGRTSGKSSYATLGESLSILKAMPGFDDFVEQLIDKLKATYPTRTSMIRILDRI